MSAIRKIACCCNHLYLLTPCVESVAATCCGIPSMPKYFSLTFNSFEWCDCMWRGWNAAGSYYNYSKILGDVPTAVLLTYTSSVGTPPTCYYEGTVAVNYHREWWRDYWPWYPDSGEADGCSDTLHNTDYFTSIKFIIGIKQSKLVEFWLVEAPSTLMNTPRVSFSQEPCTEAITVTNARACGTMYDDGSRYFEEASFEAVLTPGDILSPPDVQHCIGPGGDPIVTSTNLPALGYNVGDTVPIQVGETEEDYICCTVGLAPPESVDQGDVTGLIVEDGDCECCG